MSNPRTFRKRCRPEKFDFAKRSRQNPTAAEAVLWQEVRRDSLGFRVRRQSVIAGYVVDFLAATKRLVVEVDGGYHTTKRQIAADRVREDNLRRLGFDVVRFTNEQVLSNVSAVIAEIQQRAAVR